MTRNTHLVLAGAGTVAVIATRPMDAPSMLMLALAALIGAVAPDWDLKAGIPHRTVTHWVIWYLLIGNIPHPLAFGFALGAILHILADGLTPGGVPLLMPFTRWKLRGPIVTGSIWETVAVASAAGLLVFFGPAINIRSFFP